MKKQDLASYALLMAQLTLAGWQVGMAVQTRSTWTIGSAVFLVLLALRAILFEAASYMKKKD